MSDVNRGTEVPTHYVEQRSSSQSDVLRQRFSGDDSKVHEGRDSRVARLREEFSQEMESIKTVKAEVIKHYNTIAAETWRFGNIGDFDFHSMNQSDVQGIALSLREGAYRVNKLSGLSGEEGYNFNYEGRGDRSVNVNQRLPKEEGGIVDQETFNNTAQKALKGRKTFFGNFKSAKRERNTQALEGHISDIREHKVFLMREREVAKKVAETTFGISRARLWFNQRPEDEISKQDELHRLDNQVPSALSDALEHKAEGQSKLDGYLKEYRALRSSLDPNATDDLLDK